MFFERKGALFVGRFASLFDRADVVHGVSTRKGGVSPSPYDTLNLGTGSGDKASSVEENRRRFWEAMGIDTAQLAIPQQVHGNRIRRVTAPGGYGETDGLISDERGVVLVVQVADCLPIFLYDPRRQAIGLVHAGWRGTASEIASRCVETMESAFGTRPRDLTAFFGPSIGPCCYEVGEEVTHRFPAKYVKGGHLNLWKSNRDQLVGKGMEPDRVEISGLCTACHTEWFFSHRASGGKTGRMLALFGLR